MPIPLSSSYDPSNTLTSSYASPSEQAATAAMVQQDRLERMGLAGRALTRGVYNIGNNLNNALGGIAEPIAPGFAQQAYNDALGYQQLSQGLRSPDDISDYSQVNSLGSGLNYAANAMAENLPQVPMTVGAALLARLGLRNVALAPMAKNFIGATAGSAPMLLGENIGEMRADPTILANTTPGERLAHAAAATAVQAPMDAVGDALLMGRASGAGKAVSNVFKDGIGKTAKDAAKHVAMAVPEAALTEGVPEAGQEFVKQQALNSLNPNRDTSKDAHELANSFFGGWAAGAPMSGVGRGADVAWAQGRGATEAIRNLLTPKQLPETLKSSDDQSVLQWDDQDNAQRNAAAKGLAERILNSDAAQSLKDAAQGFYDRAAGGARDAWGSLSDALGAEEKYQNTRAGIDHFLGSIKRANEAVSGKADAEASDADNAMYKQFSTMLDSRGATARDTELKSRLFNEIKQSLLDDSWHELPWHALEDEFGTIGRATEAVTKLRENLVRTGQLDHDDEFGKLLEATMNQGQSGERAKMDVVGRYAKEFIGRSPSDSELRQGVRAIETMVQQYPSMSAQNKKKFDAMMSAQFGKNTEKVLAALAPKMKTEQGVETAAKSVDDLSGERFQTQTADEVEAPSTRFLGSAVDSARRHLADERSAKQGGPSSIEAHGGFWRLDKESALNQSHRDEMHEINAQLDDLHTQLKAAKAEGRATKRLEQRVSKLEARLNELTPDKSLTRRYNDLQAELRRDANGGNYVRALTPLEYAKEAGVDPAKIAKHLGVSVEALENHPARMLAVEPRQMNKDKSSLDGDDIKNLSEKTAKALGSVPSEVRLTPAQAKTLRDAHASGGFKAMKKAMNTMGFKHGVSVDGLKLKNNWAHGGNGIFNVHMKDGTVHRISAQHLIATMRQRDGHQSALQAFTNGVAALMAQEGVAKVTASDLFGKEDANPFAMAPNTTNYFQLMPGLNLSQAQRAERRAANVHDPVVAKLQEQLDIANDPEGSRERYEGKDNAHAQAMQKLIDKVSEMSEDERDGFIETLEKDLEDHLSAVETKQGEMEGEGQRKGSVGIMNEDDATDDAFTTAGDLTNDSPRLFNDDGTLIHPHDNKPSTGSRQNVKFNGVEMRVRPGVSGKHFSGDARKVLKKVNQLKNVLVKAGQPVESLGMAADFIARSAAAAKDGNQAAQKALVANAARTLNGIVASQMATISEEMKTAEGAEMTRLQGAYDKLTDFAAPLIELVKDYQANRDEYDALSQQYRAYTERKTAKSTEPQAPAASKGQRLVIQGRPSVSYEKQKMPGDNTTDPMQRARDDLRGKDDTIAALSADLKARAKADALLQQLADQAEEKTKAAVEEAVAQAEEAKPADPTFEGEVGKLGAALKEAVQALRQSWQDGELKKPELVAALRKALAAFKAAARIAANELTEAVRVFIKAYQSAYSETYEAVVAASAKAAQQRFNAEGSFANGTGVTQQQFQDVKDYIAKVLGPQVQTQLAQTLGGNSAAWNRVNGQTIIRIAAQASNPLSKAHHEAMHEFFQRLMDDGSPAAEILRKMAGNPLVTRQIEQFFHNDANYAAIKQAIATDEHERVAYAFQLWAAGQLKLGSQGNGFFEKIANFIRKVFHLLSNDQKAEAIMQHFHNGDMSTNNAVANVLAQDSKMMATFASRMNDFGKAAMHSVKGVAYTAHSTLVESGNPSFEKIGKLFATPTGARGEATSFFDAKVQKTNQYLDHFANLIKTMDKKDIEAAVTGLQEGRQSNDPKIARLQGSVRKMLDHLHTYMTGKGVKVRKVADYFPRVWNPIAIADNRAEFIQMLKDEHLRQTKQPLAQNIAEGIADTLVTNKGAEPVSENEFAIGYTPFMASSNKRVLDFIKSPEFAKFQEKDLEGIMTTYIAQAVHKAEYTERFGQHGEKLRAMVLDAAGEATGPEWATAQQAAQVRLDALKKQLKQQYKGDPAKQYEELVKAGYDKGELTVEQVYKELTSADAKKKFRDYEPDFNQAMRAIMAMEGTLGADINPSLRKFNAGMMVYENIRLLGLSLFSQVIDPLGVIVRGGNVEQAWDAFKKGIAGTVAKWRGVEINDDAWNLAKQLGVIDAHAYLNSQGNAYTSLFLGKTAQRFNDRLFRVNGVEGFSQGTRVGAMLAAIEFIKRHSKLPETNSQRWLEELNLAPADIKIDAKGNLDYSDPKIQQAIFRWVEGAILRPNASMRPSWASDPNFALVFHLKQFTYAMQKVLLERVVNEAKAGNYDPAVSMVLTYVPAMIAADFIRGMVSNGGQEPEWKRKWKFHDYLMDGVQRAGLLGVPQFALDTAKWGPGELVGPAGEQVYSAGKQLYKDLKKDSHLDAVANTTHNQGDVQKAEDFNGVQHAAKRTLRNALPGVWRKGFDEAVGR